MILSANSFSGSFMVCNDTGDDVAVEVQTQWRSVADGGRMIQGRTFETVRPPGCLDVLFKGAPIPAGVTPGLWQWFNS